MNCLITGWGTFRFVDDLLDWLNDELKVRSWSYNELGRQAGISGSTVSLVMAGRQKPTWEFCAGVAKAFDMPVEDVFRRAGLLRAVPDPAGVQELIDLARSLSPESLTEVTTYARYRYQQEQS